MVRQIFSVILIVERELTENAVTELVEQALADTFDFQAVKTIAVVDYEGAESYYVRITIHHYTSVSRSQIRQCMLTLPANVKVLELDREIAETRVYSAEATSLHN